jgi:hypothetical protein
MSTEKDIIIKVSAQDNTAPAFKSLEEQLNDTKKELLDLAAAGKQNTKEFQDLSARAGSLKRDIEGVEQAIDRYSKAGSAGLAAVGQAAQLMAGGFAIAQGAAALFGDENEDLQKTMMKVQASIALVTGVQQVAELLNRNSVITTKAMTLAQGLYSAAVGTSTGALKAFRIAMVSTGIGAFVVALGLAAEAMGLFSSKTEEEVENQKEVKRALDETVGTLEFYERKLRAFGTTDEQLAAIRIKRYEQERANIQKNLDDAIAAEGVRQNAYQDAARQEIEVLNVKIREEQNIIDKGIADREAAEAAARARRLEERKREFEQQKKDNETEYMQLIDGFKKYYDKLVAASTLGEMQIRGERRKGVKELMADLKSAEDLETMREQRRVDRAKQTLQGIADLTTLFAGKSEKAQKRAFDINKKASMATAIIDGISATQKAFKSAPPPLSYVLAAAAAASALVRVKAISQQQFQGGSEAGGGGGAAPSTGSAATGGEAAPPPIFGTPQSTDLGNLANNQGQGETGLRAYVVERDISDTSSRLRRMSEFATLGA